MTALFRLALPRPSPSSYTLLVAVGAMPLLAYLVVRDGAELVGELDVRLAVLVGAAVLGELFPIVVPRRDDDRALISTSGPFVLAILITYGVTAALVAQVLATLVADAQQKRAPLKTLFNVGQLTLTTTAAGGVWYALASPGPLAPTDLPAVALTACALFLVNHALVGTVVALAARMPVVSELRYDLPFQFATNLALLSFAPVVVLANDFSPLVVPLLGLPIAALYRGSRQAVLTEHQALHDALTELPNRSLLRDRGERAIALACRQDRCVSLLVLDLDRFKEVNETLGHEHGDALLRQLAARLVATVRESDTVARLGGDEFALLLPQDAAASEGVAAAERVLAALREPFELFGLQIEVQASIGIAAAPEHGADIDTLLRRADIAMYHAKSAGSGCELYDAATDASSPQKLTLLGDLRRALADEELELHYQPVVDLNTGATVGAEALVRWRHPTRGLVPPRDFVGFAEGTGLIVPMTYWALETALRQVKEWRTGGQELRVAVNVSARNLLDPGLPANLADLLERLEADPTWLELEITEGTIMTEPARAADVLQRLHEMGVAIAIDDFGTGYSSLAYLSRLPVSTLKIDRAFVRDMHESPRDAIIVSSTIDLARNLGLAVVGEGVETEAAADTLAASGCALAQGFLFSPALPADAFAEWSAARRPLVESAGRRREESTPGR